MRRSGRWQDHRSNVRLTATLHVDTSMPFGLIASLLLASTGASSMPDETPIACGNCADWNQPQAPFRVYCNTYYVGMHGLSSVLIVTTDGLILLDGDLP